MHIAFAERPAFAGRDAQLDHFLGDSFDRLIWQTVGFKNKLDELDPLGVRHVDTLAVFNHSFVSWRRRRWQPALRQLFRPAFHGFFAEVVGVLFGDR